MIADVLSREDAQLLCATLGRLRLAGVSHFALTGGTAIAWHKAKESGRPEHRRLHDVDIVVEDFNAIPSDLGSAFLLRHIHSDALPGRMLAQAYDPTNGLRVDIFSAYGRTLDRSISADLEGTSLHSVSRGELIARLTTLLLALRLGEPVSPKHARDYSHLIDYGADEEIELAWIEHRKKIHPVRFAAARKTVSMLILNRPELLIDAEHPYKATPCLSCREHPTLKLTSLARIEALEMLRSRLAQMRTEAG